MVGALFRRRDPRDMETARGMVSRAEHDALVEAERARNDAAEQLRRAVAHREGVEHEVEVRLARAREEAGQELDRARKEAVLLLSDAIRQVEDLLTLAAQAADRDRDLAAAAQAQLRQESDQVAEVRAEADAALAAALEDGRRVRQVAVDEADRVLARARREARAALVTVRRQLSSEIVDLLDAMDGARRRFEGFLVTARGSASGGDHGWMAGSGPTPSTGTPTAGDRPSQGRSAVPASARSAF